MYNCCGSGTDRSDGTRNRHGCTGSHRSPPNAPQSTQSLVSHAPWCTHTVCRGVQAMVGGRGAHHQAQVAERCRPSSVGSRQVQVWLARSAAAEPAAAAEATTAAARQPLEPLESDPAFRLEPSARHLPPSTGGSGSCCTTYYARLRAAAARPPFRHAPAALPKQCLPGLRHDWRPSDCDMCRRPAPGPRRARRTSR